jgi:hypothetical protein
MNNDLTERVKALAEKALARSAGKVVKLPFCPDTKRATPNSFLQSALFSATRGKEDMDRPHIYGEIVASQAGITVKYTGVQLNQDDLTLWETLVHMAKDSPLGDSCEFSSYSILKALGLNTGGNEIQRLRKGITRLIACSVEIALDGSKAYESSLVMSSSSDKLTDKYVIKLSKELLTLYANNTWIDWEQRVKLRKKPLAQSLHGYYSSHKRPFPVKIATLHKYSGSSNKQTSGFKRQVIAALEDLVKIGFLKSYSVDDGKVSVEKLSGLDTQSYRG